MNAKRILCPVDFTPASDAALSLASSLARDSGAMLHILYVQEVAPPLGVNVGDYHKLWASLPKATNVQFEHHLLQGHPADEIGRFAKDNDVDLIVMGTYGRHGVARIMLGSVAEAVMRSSDVPVLTVRPHAKNLEPVLSAGEDGDSDE